MLFYKGYNVMSKSKRIELIGVNKISNPSDTFEDVITYSIEYDEYGNEICNEDSTDEEIDNEKV
jgi:hypothetical protein